MNKITINVEALVNKHIKDNKAVDDLVVIRTIQNVNGQYIKITVKVDLEVIEND